MALRVVSHIPTINATGVYRNDSIQVTFSKRIRTESVDYTSFTVNDHDTFSSIPGGYSINYDISGNALTAVFTPSILFTPNTVYDVFVFGKPDSILAIDNDSIPSTYTYSFTTGTGVWAEAGVSGLPASGYGVSYSVLSGIHLEVTATSPKNREPNLSEIEYIKIDFNYRPNLSGINIYDYVTVTSQDVL